VRDHSHKEVEKLLAGNSEKRIEKNISGVAVITADGGKVEPATTSVTLLGPASLLETAKSEQFRIILDGEHLEPRIELPKMFQGSVTLKSVHTAKFVPVK